MCVKLLNALWEVTKKENNQLMLAVVACTDSEVTGFVRPASADVVHRAPDDHQPNRAK